ncbi:Cystinosin-like protein [Armadillidium nasatum]|uniref:Cystinosin homolog n=1 Tax=Armadillidium nasatum TaxID=96803 RepID=A0A5N5SLY4_9CRUS|nr:Cystinosin-like protein [Armadillidium nasatum]
MFKICKQQRRVKHNLDNGNFFCLEYFIIFLFLIQLQFVKCEETFPVLNKLSSDNGSGVNNDSSGKISVNILKHDICISVGESVNLSYTISPINISNITLIFNSTNNNIFNGLPNTLTVYEANSTQEEYITLKAKGKGYALLTANTTMPQNMTDLSGAFTRMSVHYSSGLDYLSDVVGWTYFIAWSISFYPQIMLNWRRKSVIGLHFDFLALNTLGFLVYSLFNIGLYSIPEVKIEYFKRHPYGVNPVQLNDVIFSIHAFFACIIQVIQCIIYERGDQKVSRTGRTLIGSFIIMAIVALILGSTTVIAWIDFLYFLSYIKLVITLIKYIPQAYYNYLRKSTSGWSIGNILLDFTGGTLSICQMFIISYNYDDWDSIFGDPTKFGLGLFSILFDIFFIFQHYVFYKERENYMPFPDSPSLTRSSSSVSPNNYGSLE